MAFHVLDFFVFGVGINLCKYRVNLFEFEVDDVVHHSCCKVDMLLEFLEVELSLRCERIVNIRIQVQCQQSARIVWTKRNFAAGVGRNRTVAKVGVAVGN